MHDIAHGRILPAILALIAVLMTGCDRKPGETGGETGAPVATAPVEVRLGYFANLTHAQAVLGVQFGDFERAIAPTKLTTRVFNAGPSLIEALFAGEIDIAYVGPSPALSAFEKSKGEGIRVLAGAAANGVVIVARKDAGIKTMADLAGKRIATPQMGNTQDIAARHYLIQQLKQPNADNVLPVPNAEQLAMMERGQIDAAWAPEPWGTRLEQEAGGVLVAEEKDLWPNGQFVLTVVIGQPEFVQKHPDLVEKMLRTHAALTVELTSNAVAQVSRLQEAMQTLTGKQIAASLIEQSLKRVKFTTDPMPETFETFAQWSVDLGFSRAKPDLKSLFDREILDKVLSGTSP